MDKFEDFIQDRLFYHNSYLPTKSKDWEVYNKILIDQLLVWLSPIRRKRMNKLKMREEIIRLRELGDTFDDIAKKYGTSRQRIHQIYKDN